MFLCFFFSVHLLEGSPPITCTSCDPNGRRDAAVEGFNLQLADSAIFIFHSCASRCVLNQTLDFDPRVCSPSYLQAPISDPHQLYVICASRPRVLPVSYSARNGNFSIKGPFQEATDEFAPTRGIVVGGIIEVGRKGDFLIWIDSDRQSIGLNALGSHVIPDSLPVDDTSCDAFEALYPMDPSSDRSHPRFLLQCSQNSATKLYEVTLDFTSGNPRASGEVPGFVGSPILSPNSTYLCLWTDSSITIFQTADYSKQRFKPFTSPITAAYFVQSDPPSHKLFVSAGSASELIDVAEFFTDPGSGVVAVPGSAANCASDGHCLPQRLSGNHHLVIVRDGSAWQARIYRVDEPSEPPTIFHLSEPPVSAFLQLSSSPSPTPNRTWIIGVGIAGAFAGIAVTAVLLCVCCCRWRRERHKQRLHCGVSNCSPEAEVKESSKPNKESASPNLKPDSTPPRLTVDSTPPRLTVDSTPPRLTVDSTPPRLTANPAPPNLKADANPVADKEAPKDPLNTSQIEIKVDSQWPMQASTPVSTRDKIALSKPDHTTLTLDRGPTHLLTPQPDRQRQLDSGVNSSSSSLASLPSRSSSSSVMDSRTNSPGDSSRSNSPGNRRRSNSPGNGRRSNSPGDGCSLSGDDLPPPQVCHNSSSSGATQMVAPQFSQHHTSP